MCVSALSALIALMPLQAQQGQPVENPPAVIRATGIGKPPQGRPAAQSRLMARRAAEVVAIRNLAAKVHGLTVDPTEGTGRMTTAARIRGFRYVSTRSLPDGRVEVTVELPLARLGEHAAAIALERPVVQARWARAKTQVAAVNARIKSLKRRTKARIAEIERELSTSWYALLRGSSIGRSPGSAHRP